MSYTKITNFATKDSTNDIIKGTEFDDEFNSIEASFTAQPSATQVLTNKTVNLTSNTLSGTTAQFNTALSDGNFATLAGSETLTNKALNGSLGATTPSTVVATDLTTTGNTILGNASTDTLNVGNGDLVKDASGNVGIGVTPSAWGAPLSHAIELVQGTGITAHSGSASSYYTSNAYYNGSNWIYKSSVKATLMTMSGADGTFVWNTAPTGTAGNAITFTQAMTLDASGNLGLGVTPSAWYTSGFVTTQIGAAGIFSKLAGNDLRITDNTYLNTSGVYKYLNTDYATRYEQGAGTHAWYIAPSGTAGNTATFTQAMTLDASGNLLVGATATNLGAFTVLNNATNFATNQAVAYIKSTQASDVAVPALYLVKTDNNSTTSQILVKFGINAGANGQGQINGNGANAAAFGTFSDARLKENIIGIPEQLNNILTLNPCEFDFKDGSGHQIGFIAQEMQQVYPDVVSENSEGYLTITGWSKTEARLVKAIQEQQALITNLTARLEALEAK